MASVKIELVSRRAYSRRVLRRARQAGEARFCVIRRARRPMRTDEFTVTARNAVGLPVEYS
jgi:hypothetical protein